MSVANLLGGESEEKKVDLLALQTNSRGFLIYPDGTNVTDGNGYLIHEREVDEVFNVRGTRYTIKDGYVVYQKTGKRVLDDLKSGKCGMVPFNSEEVIIREEVNIAPLLQLGNVDF